MSILDRPPSLKGGVGGKVGILEASRWLLAGVVDVWLSVGGLSVETAESRRDLRLERNFRASILVMTVL